MKKIYFPIPLRDGRDSIRVRLIPRLAKTPRISARSPTRSISGSTRRLHFVHPARSRGRGEISTNLVVLSLLF